MQTHILVVSADALQAKLLRALLASQDYTVTTINDPRAILDTLARQTIDLVVVDVALPWQDGYSLCAQLKRTHSNIGVVLLSDRHATEDLVRAFSHGADDCLMRPYEPAELLARLQGVLRRYRRVERNRYGALIKVGNTSLDLSRLTFRGAQGTEVALAPTEMRILECLMRSAHMVLPRERLIEHVWGYDCESADNRVDVYIRRLRRKIEGDTPGRALIRTIRGAGYVYQGDVPFDGQCA